MIIDIVKSLKLDVHDTLIDMCCGNGLITSPLSFYVKYIYAFDFTEHLIKSAIHLKHANNIQYVVGDGKADFYKFFILDEKPTKILMNDSLGYFSPKDLRDLLVYVIKEVGFFTFYITGVPNDNLKWNFYNTEERRLRYLDCLERGDVTHDGIGNWWSPDQIKQICDELGLRFEINNQPDFLSNYRSNLLIINE
jgi:predicted TPR repeat methyltransferase